MNKTPALDLEDWHQRYLQQASWSQDVRRHLLEKVTLLPGDKILEVGSGTSAVLSLMAQETESMPFGIDIDLPSLNFSAKRNQRLHLSGADGYRLPFPDSTFALTYCHYLLLWVEDPRSILGEMARVTRSGGGIIALAEPDYLARIDAPLTLEVLGDMQNDALKAQGADIATGRKLSGLFFQAGLKDITVGILGAHWRQDSLQNIDEREWGMIQSDLADVLPQESIDLFHNEEIKARGTGERILFIPTFYAAATK